MIQYVVYDVFTDKPFGGNPLAVVQDATGLTDAQLPLIAREFGFSETTFVFPPKDDTNDALVRIFTPERELAFAGHPTVGTAIALFDLGLCGPEMVLELGVGPIPVTVRNGQARFVTRIPLATQNGPPAEALAQAIDQPTQSVCTDRHTPTIAGLGNDFLCVELNNLEALAKASVDSNAFLKIAGPKASSLGLYLYVRNETQIQARMLEPWGGIPEDPATGSAAAALVALLGRLDGRSTTYTIRQGVEMGRPSLITGAVTVESAEPISVAISGNAVRVMEGKLTL